MSRFIAAKYTGRCYRCEGAIHVGDRILWDSDLRVSAHEACMVCKQCKRISDEVAIEDGICRKCSVENHAKSPEGQAAAKERRTHAALKAAETRRARKALRECKHITATRRDVPNGSVLRECPFCGLTRYENKDGSVWSDAGRVFDWGWDD